MYKPAAGESVVLSACGENVDWYRNIEVTLALEVQIASARYVPEQRFFLVPEAQREVVR